MANTLFLQLHCPIVRPEMIVVSDYGQTTIDFGSASIGQELLRSIIVQNISNKTIQVQRNDDSNFQKNNQSKMNFSCIVRY